jgi:hypothetical protein
MDVTTHNRLLGDLRETFSSRLPAGLTEKADTRLRRTLEHFVGEVKRIRGVIDEKEVLRETYESMTGWFRRNTDQILGTPVSPFRPADVESAVAPDLIPGGGGLHAIGGERMDGEVEDPLSMFHMATTDMDRFLRPEPSAGSPPAMPVALKPLETRAAIVDYTATALSVPAVPAQAKDFLQKQEDVVKYREVEYNLLLNSKDRDWLNNGNKQNRYNFSVVLDSTARPQGTGPQPTITNRFRNIVRVEFVKAILPVEGLEVLNDPSGADTTGCYSVLALPFINVLLDEWTGNNVGTNPTIDQSLAICQYDATWRSDGFISNTTSSRGYTLFIPKFMKAQRIYAPTPLSNFQRLSFQILSPESQQLSKMPDSSAVNAIVNGSLSGSTLFGDTKYIAIVTKEYFPQWAYSYLDKVTFAGLTFNSATTVVDAGGKALIEWLQRPEGNVVLGVGYTNTTISSIADGANDCGYANVIFIKNRLIDPSSTGLCDTDPFTPNDSDMYSEMADYPESYQEGGVLNLSRQVQLVLRVVTRELDPTTTTRPDNI